MTPKTFASTSLLLAISPFLASCAQAQNPGTPVSAVAPLPDTHLSDRELFEMLDASRP